MGEMLTLSPPTQKEVKAEKEDSQVAIPANCLGTQETDFL